MIDTTLGQAASMGCSCLVAAAAAAAAAAAVTPAVSIRHCVQLCTHQLELPPPVPQESMLNCEDSPAFSTTDVNTASALGDLPQVHRERYGVEFGG